MEERVIDLDFLECLATSLVQSDSREEVDQGIMLKNLIEDYKLCKKQLNGAFDRGFISLEKLSQKRWECLQKAGPYDCDNATLEQHQLMGGFATLNKILSEANYL